MGGAKNIEPDVCLGREEVPLGKGELEVSQVARPEQKWFFQV